MARADQADAARSAMHAPSSGFAESRFSRTANFSAA
jgi:hypothetical protein